MLMVNSSIYFFYFKFVLLSEISQWFKHFSNAALSVTQTVLYYDTLSCTNNYAEIEDLLGRYKIEKIIKYSSDADRKQYK